jgi:hypothetical protein
MDVALGDEYGLDSTLLTDSRRGVLCEIARIFFSWQFPGDFTALPENCAGKFLSPIICRESAATRFEHICSGLDWLFGGMLLVCDIDDSACYGVLRFIMESGAKGCEVVVSGKLRAARAKSMKFTDGFMIHSGQPVAPSQRG